MSFSAADEHFMQLALNESLKGEGFTAPNPMVGAAIVKDGRLLALGYHHKCGGPHAEIEALKSLSPQETQGATIYVTLEPCSHYGRTPPCCEALAKAGLARVVAAMRDPNPLVSGRGLSYLREKGLEVEVGLLEAEAKKINEIFLYYIQNKSPFVTLKLAQSLDGVTALFNGESKWITGEEARAAGRRLRHTHAAILVGANTVRLDNPALTTRFAGGCDPIKIVLSSHGLIPETAQIFKEGHTIVALGEDSKDEQKERLSNLGAEIITLPLKDGRPDPRALLPLLAERQISSLLVEGGAKVITSFLKDNLVNKLEIFVAPLIIGGEKSRHSVGELNLLKLAEARHFTFRALEKCGNDLHLTAYPLP